MVLTMPALACGISAIMSRDFSTSLSQTSPTVLIAPLGMPAASINGSHSSRARCLMMSLTRGQDVAIANTVGCLGKTRIVGQFRPLDHAAKTFPQFVIGDAEADPAIARL